jgi:thiol-disulfide isomerase/thioredoxin
VRRVALAAATLAIAIAVTGCVEDTDLDQQGVNYNADTKGYSQFDPDDRGDPVEFTATFPGETEDAADDTIVSSGDLRGDVVVVNFWYADCPPCRVEAPFLNEAFEEFAGQDVTFIGVNTRDNLARARTFEAEFDVPYGSTLDVDGGDMLLAFASDRPANATPTTLVLDKQGRVAARLLGQLDSAALLETFISDALAEG